jgi:hypothetical protein
MVSGRSVSMPAGYQGGPNSSKGPLRQAMASAAVPAVRADAVPFLVVDAPTRRNAAQYSCYDGFGHDAPFRGALWQVPARRSRDGSGRLKRAECRRLQ